MAKKSWEDFWKVSGKQGERIIEVKVTKDFSEPDIRYISHLDKVEPYDVFDLKDKQDKERYIKSYQLHK